MNLTRIIARHMVSLAGKPAFVQKSHPRIAISNHCLLAKRHMTLVKEENNQTNSQQSGNLIVDNKAQERLKKVLDKDECLRIGVKGGGCSGFEYQLDIVTKTQPSDEDIVLCDGLVVIDKESLEYMSGATLEYEEELIRSGFKISNNPLAEKGCSCGASFSLKF